MLKVEVGEAWKKKLNKVRITYILVLVYYLSENLSAYQGLLT